MTNSFPHSVGKGKLWLWSIPKNCTVGKDGRKGYDYVQLSASCSFQRCHNFETEISEVGSGQI